MAPDHIGQLGPPHASHKLKVQYSVLHSFCPIFLINFGRLSIVGSFLFQFLLMLVLQHRCAVGTSNLADLGAMFHCLEHECCELEVLHHQDGNLVPHVWHLLAH